MADIVLIQPPIRDFYLTAKRTIPYGLAGIAAALIEKGFSVELIDGLARRKAAACPRPPEMDYLDPYYGRPDRSPFGLFHAYRRYGHRSGAIAERAAASAPFLVGISSSFTPYSAEALQTAEAVKERLTACRVVLGGHHPTVMPESVMACRAVDFVIRGEGEPAMPRLAEALGKGRGIRRVPGIVFREADGRLFISEPAVMDDPDRFPLPAMDLVDHAFYGRKTGTSTVVVSSRGCPMHCSYCSMGSDTALSYRLRTVDAVVGEIERAVHRHGARFVDFEDENLSLNREWFVRLLTAIRERFRGQNLELRAMNGLFPPTLDDETVTLMQAAGFKTLNLSLGTTAPGQLRRFRRPDVSAAMDRVLDRAERCGMTAVAYIIVGAPFQNAADSLADLLFLARRRVLAGVSVYYPVPATRDYDRCRRAGVLPPALSLYRSSALPVSHTTSREEAVTLLRLGRILNFMKALKDRGDTLPAPETCGPSVPVDAGDRYGLGRRLLSWFLADGRIRGVTPDGTVYTHAAARSLTDPFVAAVRGRGVTGSR